MAQLKVSATRKKAPMGLPTNEEAAALDRFIRTPMACLETSIQVNPIRAARETAGITQADLAFAMRISQPMLSRQEQAFRRLRPASITRALETLRRIQENRNRPPVSLDDVLADYGARLAASAARKPRDPVERRLLREMGDPVALRESEAQVREAGARRRPPKAKIKAKGRAK